MRLQKERYEKIAPYMQKGVKINLSGWPKTKHDASIKFVDLKEGDFILDVGCGRGDHFPYYLKKTKNVYGIDISKNLLKEVPLKDMVNLSCQDFEKGTSFKNEFFDYIVIIDVIEHLINRYEAIRELKRILKRGGKLMIITPNIAKARNRLRLLLGKYPHTAAKEVKQGSDLYDSGHIQYFTFKTLRDLAEGEGFQVLGEYGFGRFGRIHNIFKSLMSGSICIILRKI